MSPLNIPQLSDLSVALHCPDELAAGSRDLQHVALKATQYVFDISLQSEPLSRPHILDLLSSITPSQAPRTRSQARANAVERTSPPAKATFNPTPLTSLFVDNMDEDQVWEQLDLRTKHICELLDLVLEGELGDEDEDHGEESDDGLHDALKALREEQGIEFDDLDEDLGSDEIDLSEEDGLHDDSEDSEADAHSSVLEEEGVMDLYETSSDDEEEGSRNSVIGTHATPSRKKKKGQSELDDGFFDLSTFNAETERAESRTTSRGHLADDDDSDDDSMDIDLFAPVDGSEVDDEEDTENDSNELFYKDFFEPPPRTESSRKKSVQSPGKSNQVRFHEEVRVKKIRPSGKNKPLREEYSLGGFGNDDVGTDGETTFELCGGFDVDDGSEMGDSVEDGETETKTRETINRLKDDLFADEVDNRGTGDMTTHESRMASLKDQIQELESENISNRHWTLMGEADSRSRPQNSLLEEDLEFDRVMKAVPVITEEVVQSLEELIKSRILEGRFDDVVRLRPFDDKAFLPSRLLELQDTKSTQSLAQIYESEYVAAQSGDAALDDRDGKLKKEHEEIEQLWENISGKLDALCNAFFVPKQMKSAISTISNVSTATLESALPTTKSATTLLAPEEVFAAESSQPRSRSELTPSEKRALRMKERKTKKKRRDVLSQTVDKFAKKSMGSVKKQKQAALDSVVKHGKGVTVVGKNSKELPKRRDKRS